MFYYIICSRRSAHRTVYLTCLKTVTVLSPGNDGDERDLERVPCDRCDSLLLIQEEDVHDDEDVYDDYDEGDYDEDDESEDEMINVPDEEKTPVCTPVDSARSRWLSRFAPLSSEAGHV